MYVHYIDVYTLMYTLMYNKHFIDVYTIHWCIYNVWCTLYWCIYITL